MKTNALLWMSLLSLSLSGHAAELKPIRLHPGAAPGSEDWQHEEKENNNNLWQTRIVYNVAAPTLTPVLPEAGKATGTAVIICPGGAFHALSIDSEGLMVAKWLAERGVSAFVLKYRLVKSETEDPTRELGRKGARFQEDVKAVVPLAMSDGLAAIELVRKRAGEWKINPDRIGIIGFSAGGTVAASVAYNYTPASKPNFVAPIYLAYEWAIKKDVPSDAPPMFILAATDDPLNLAPHSVNLYQDWTKASHSAELHLYSKGGHGFGMRTQNLPSDKWIELFAQWLKVQGF